MFEKVKCVLLFPSLLACSVCAILKYILYTLARHLLRREEGRERKVESDPTRFFL